MEGDRLLKINQALREVARSTGLFSEAREGADNDRKLYELAENMGWSPEVRERADKARSLSYEDQVGLFKKIADETLTAAKEILALRPHGQVACSLGEYLITLGNRTVENPEGNIEAETVAIYREGAGLEKAGLLDDDAIACVTRGDGGSKVVLAPLVRINPEDSTPQLDNNWYGIFDAHETLQAIHGAIIADASTPQS